MRRAIRWCWTWFLWYVCPYIGLGGWADRRLFSHPKFVALVEAAIADLRAGRVYDEKGRWLGEGPDPMEAK